MARAYLDDRTYDLFLSYAHDGNLGPTPWVEVFHDRLKAELASRIGDVAIFKDDRSIELSDRWRHAIDEAIDKSGIFVAILNGTYYESHYCAYELARFIQSDKNGTASTPRELLPVRRTPPPRQTHESRAITSRQHAQFFDFDPPGTALVREFATGKTQDAALKFESALQRLIAQLELNLKAMKGKYDECALGHVFLSEVDFDQFGTRDRIRADLRQHHYHVLQNTARYVGDDDEVRDWISADLAKADACVHLISGRCGEEPGMVARSRMQLDMAVGAMRQAGKPMPVVWIEHAASADAAGAELIDHVRTTLADQGVKFWSGSVEEFKADLFARLAAARQAASAAPQDIAPVGFVVESGDTEISPELSGVLVDELQIEPVKLKFDQLSCRVPVAMNRLASRSAARCIVFWGRQSEEWLAELLQSDSISRFGGKDRLCIYCAHPVDADKRAYRSSRARIVLATAEDRVAQLRDFVGWPAMQ